MSEYVNKPITIRLRLQGGVGSVIPKGVTEELVINVRDGSATFHFKDSKTTKAFAIFQTKDGTPTKYVERIQTAIGYYEGMKKQEISDMLMKKLKNLEKKQ